MGDNLEVGGGVGKVGSKSTSFLPARKVTNLCEIEGNGP